MTAALRSAPPRGLPSRVELHDVPFFAQDDTLCGPAVLASVLAAAGRAEPMEALVPQVYLPGRAGSLQAEMLAAARRHGLLTVELAPDLSSALRELAAGWPVAVLLNLALPLWPRWHYAVMVGYDLPGERVWLHSGTRARAEWPLSTFEYTWARSGHWAFVALAPGALPADAPATAVIRALLAGDRAAAPADAAVAWAAAAGRWPDRQLLWLGAGNAWLSAGRPAAAVAVLEQAAQRFDSALAWNNLAQARLRQGDRAGAESAAVRAVARAEAGEPDWLAAARRTLEDVRR